MLQEIHNITHSKKIDESIIFFFSVNNSEIVMECLTHKIINEKEKKLCKLRQKRREGQELKGVKEEETGDVIAIRQEFQVIAKKKR